MIVPVKRTYSNLLVISLIIKNRMKHNKTIYIFFRNYFYKSEIKNCSCCCSCCKCCCPCCRCFCSCCKCYCSCCKCLLLMLPLLLLVLQVFLLMLQMLLLVLQVLLLVWQSLLLVFRCCCPVTVVAARVAGVTVHVDARAQPQMLLIIFKPGCDCVTG